MKLQGITFLRRNKVASRKVVLAQVERYSTQKTLQEFTEILTNRYLSSEGENGKEVV